MTKLPWGFNKLQYFKQLEIRKLEPGTEQLLYRLLFVSVVIINQYNQILHGTKF